MDEGVGFLAPQIALVPIELLVLTPSLCDGIVHFSELVEPLNVATNRALEE